MKKNRLFGIVFYALSIFLSVRFTAVHAASLLVSDLKCEYKINPIGIDVVRPRLSWRLESTGRGVLQSAYEIRAAKNPDALDSPAACLWTTGRVQSDRSIHVEYGGPALNSGERVYWRVRVWDNRGHRSGWSAPAFWEMGLLSPADWKADWIRADVKEDTFSNPCPMLRREFMAKGPAVRSARVYVTCLGLYLAEINGRLVTDALFTPGWTAYTKRLQVQAYDVTSLLKPGRNVVGVMLGDGWYRGYMTWDKRNRKYGDKLELLFQMRIVYRDGTEEWVVSDSTWKSTNAGPVRMSDIYNGETYDARLEMPGWSCAGFDDAPWPGVVVTDGRKDILAAQAGPSVRRMEEIRPVRIFKAPNGDTVVDMGQNMVGWVRLKTGGPSGTEIVLRHAEVLDKNGNAYFENLRSARQTNRYILKGSGIETFEPHFSFQGFRYLTVSGFHGEPSLGDFTGVVVYSDIPQTGWFECSSPLVNRLQQNIQWSQKGNFLDVPTDCPQRDERLGWTGDAQVFARTACFNADVAAFYTKWLQDLAADQRPNGAVPHVIPDILSFNDSTACAAAGWADAAVIVPWTVYLCYGDRRILERQYPSMKAWVEFMRARARISPVDSMLWDMDITFGDWLSFKSDWPGYPGATTDMDLISAAYFARSTDLLQRAAVVLGYGEDAEKYAALLQNIKRAYEKEYITPNGRLASNTQTAYAVALAFGLVPDRFLETTVKRFGWAVHMWGHLTTGFLGTPLLCPVLTQVGKLEDAYRLLNRAEYPSWLYPVTQGATTIWERWDGIKPDSTFQDKGMNSFNHYAYGAIGEWLYSCVAGIELDEKNPGYKRILIRPHSGGGLTYAKARLLTMYGQAASEWKIKDGRMTLVAEVPPNTTAALTPPEAKTDEITEGGKPLNRAEGVRLAKEGDKTVIELGSGRYVFSWPMHSISQEEK
jgi:alpha-L-rhamnosidase